MPLTPEQQKRADEYFTKQKSGTMTVGDYAKNRMIEVEEFNEPKVSSRIKDILQKRGQQMMERQIGLAKTGFVGPREKTKILATGVGAVQDIGAELIGEGLSRITPEPIKQKFGEVLTSSAESPAIQKAFSAYEQLQKTNPEIAEQFQDLLDLAGAIPAEAGLSAAGKGVGRAGRVLKETGEAVAAKGAKAVAPLKPFATFAVEKGIGAKEAIKGAAERIPVNIAERQAKRATLEALSPLAQKAARGGIDVKDLQLIESASPAEKVIFKEMVQSSKLGKKDPSEIVGRELRKPLELAEKQKEEVGQRLGEAAKKIPTNKSINVQGKVLERLQATPGLRGIKMAEKQTGDKLLDFSDTVLSGSLTKGDREVIEKAFIDAVQRSQNPYQAHRYRQELFETLGGKKRAKVELTDTQEQGLDAIRQGLADAIEDVSPSYKTLNKEYAQIVQPLKEMRKFFKNVAGADEDILDMRAGLLARRLSSNAQTNPEIRQILRDIESSMSKYGYKQAVDASKLQDFYNSLSRYYEIKAPTGLAGQIELGMGSSASTRGLLEKGLETVAKEGMVSPATQKRALEELFSL